MYKTVSIVTLSLSTATLLTSSLVNAASTFTCPLTVTCKGNLTKPSSVVCSSSSIPKILKFRPVTPSSYPPGGVVTHGTLGGGNPGGGPLANSGMWTGYAGGSGYLSGCQYTLHGSPGASNTAGTFGTNSTRITMVKDTGWAPYGHGIQNMYVCPVGTTTCLFQVGVPTQHH